MIKRPLPCEKLPVEKGDFWGIVVKITKWQKNTKNLLTIEEKFSIL
jgi:hypothetical protein